MKTFVIRLWTGAADVEGHTASRDLHGTVEPIGAGPARPFRDGPGLLALLHSALEADVEAHRTDRRSKS